jgi:rfaE bifunctional protein kinase chain/domain
MKIGRLTQILQKIANVSITVVGDYCLDEYLLIDPGKDEPSLETGLTAYQVIKRVTSPGAAGTVAKNLAHLKCKGVNAIGYIGDDGRGWELARGLKDLNIDCSGLIKAADRVTFTYTKPCKMIDGFAKELNRLDIKNHSLTPFDLEKAIMERIRQAAAVSDAIIIMDQITERNCGVITDRVREYLCGMHHEYPNLIIYADSRSLIGRFHNIIIKGNQYEMVKSALGDGADADDPEIIKSCCFAISKKNEKPMAVTMGEKGTYVFNGDEAVHIPAFLVEGPIDVCGAGDSFSAGFVSALAVGATLHEAGYIGNLAASICVSQLGGTGIVTPELMEKTLTSLSAPS